MHATLPNGLSSREHSIASMQVGSSAWTVPWAMYHDEDRKLWLNGNYTITSAPGGTVQMMIRRDKDGWHVNATQCRGHQWSGGGYVGKFEPIPVTSFVY